MKNHDETTQRKKRRTFAQEMQQAFADWVKELPLIRDIPQAPAKEKIGSSGPLISHPTKGGRSW
jgi:hypothetical protein